MGSSAELLEEVLRGDAFIQVNKKLIKEIGLHEAILIAELFSERRYWRNENKLVEGEWFYSTRENLEENTGLTPYYQREALNNLEQLGIIETKMMNLPAKKFYRVVDSKLLKALTACNETVLQQDVEALNDINKNNIIKIKEVEGKPSTPAELATINHTRNFRNTKNTLTDDLNSIGELEEKKAQQKKEKKKTLYEKCIDEIAKPKYGFSSEVQAALRDYITFAIQPTDSGKHIKGINMLPYKLNALISVAGKDSKEQLAVIAQSLNNSAYGFFKLGYFSDKSSASQHECFADTVIVNEKSRKQQLEELEKNRQLYGEY